MNAEIKNLKTPYNVREYLSKLTGTNNPYSWNTDILSSRFKKTELAHMFYAVYEQTDNPVLKLPNAGRRVDILQAISKYFISMDRVQRLKP